MKLIDKLSIQSISHRNYFKKAYVTEHRYIPTDFYVLLYNYLNQHDMFKNYPMRFEPAFNKDLTSSLNQNTDLPNTKLDESNYYNQFFEFSYVLSLFSYMNVLMYYDLYRRINILSITDDIIRQETKENKDIKIDKKSLIHSISKKINKTIDPLQYNSFINTIFFFKSIKEFNYEYLKEYNPDYIESDIMTFINKLFDDILEAHPVLQKEYNKYKKKNNKRVKLNSKLVNLKMRFYSFITLIRNEICSLFMLPGFITDPVQLYKNELFNMNFDDHKRYKNMFQQTISNMKNAYDSFGSDLIIKHFNDIYYLFGKFTNPQKNTELLIDKNEFQECMQNMEKYMNSASKLFTSVCNTIREVKSYLYVYNKRYM